MGASYDPIFNPTANTRIVIGTYTGNGALGREINVGGEAKAGFIVADTTIGGSLWFVVKGAVNVFVKPALMQYDGTANKVQSSGGQQVKSSSHGFTLAVVDGVNASNENLIVYYYVVFLEVP